MHKTGGPQRLVRIFGVGILVASLSLSLGSLASAADQTPDPAVVTADAPAVTPGPVTDAPAAQGDGSTLPPAVEPQAVAPAAAAPTPPYGANYPVTIETDFSRPYKAISNSANSDFSLLNDLERLIRGSYKTPAGSLRSDRKSNYVYLSISRMENSHRVGRELIKAAKAGVRVRVIHGMASQSRESRSLQRSLNSSKLRDSAFKICRKGRSLACLSDRRGAIMHSKMLMINRTYTRDNKKAIGAVWSGSANLGGPSGEKTYNNGWTVYNDEKQFRQMGVLWKDMWAERDVNSNYPAYVQKHANRYGYSGATADGYTSNYASRGMFYSNLSNTTIYPTPIYASPTNGRDPVMNALNRVVPDDKCRIRIQHNRFKYRRIAVAQKLVALANAGCKISAVSFEDDLKINRKAHCQSYIRICKPILDVFRTANVRIEAAWAKPHDKTMLIEANMKVGPWNTEERLPDGSSFKSHPGGVARVKFVQAGSAALTGSNLITSDEITTESTNPAVYEDYLQHWKAILKSRDYRNYVY